MSSHTLALGAGISAYLLSIKLTSSLIKPVQLVPFIIKKKKPVI